MMIKKDPLATHTQFIIKANKYVDNETAMNVKEDIWRESREERRQYTYMYICIYIPCERTEKKDMAEE